MLAEERLVDEFTVKEVVSSTGIITGYVLLLIMALVSIFVGSLRSIAYRNLNMKIPEKFEDEQDRAHKPRYRSISMKDALMFPVFSLRELVAYFSILALTGTVIGNMWILIIMIRNYGLFNIKQSEDGKDETHMTMKDALMSPVYVVITLFGLYLSYKCHVYVFAILMLVIAIAFIVNYIKKAGRASFFTIPKYILELQRKERAILKFEFSAISVLIIPVILVVWYFIRKIVQQAEISFVYAFVWTEIFFKTESSVSQLLSIFSFSVKVMALTRTGCLIINSFIKIFKLRGIHEYMVLLHKKQKGQVYGVFRLESIVIGIIAFFVSVIIVTWNILTQYWVLTEIIGMSVCLNGIEMVSLESVFLGCALLGGVFCNNMKYPLLAFGRGGLLTVTKLPIKYLPPFFLVPVDLPENGLNASSFRGLMLADIFIPGLFIALLCRFDHNHHPSKFKIYFFVGLLAYTIGLLTKVAVLIFFNIHWPLPLYITPVCVVFPLILAVLRGEIGSLFAYTDSVFLKAWPG